MFQIANVNDAVCFRIFGSKLVDRIKREGTSQAIEKPRLVVQGHNNDQHGLITHSPTVQRASQIPLLRLAPCDPALTIFVRDVK